MRREYRVVLLSVPTGMLGEIGRKSVSTSKLKCPSLQTDFNLTCTACIACAGSTMWYYSVFSTALLREIRTKNCFDLKNEVSLITDRLQRK
jgi:hypothetical protein